MKKVINNKNIILSVCLAISSALYLTISGKLPLFNRLGGINPGINQLFISNDPCPNPATLLAQTESDLWAELSNLGITLEKINESCHLAGPDGRSYPENRSLLSTTTLTCINGVCADFGINPQDIKMTVWTNSESPAAATDYGLLVNDQSFKKLSPKVQRFIIAHELQHYKTKDFSIGQTVKALLKGKEDQHAFESLTHRFSRFLEARADYGACSQKAIYAEGQKEFSENLIAQHGENVFTRTHPQNQERLAMANTVLSTIHNV